MKRRHGFDFEDINRELRLCYGVHQAFLRIGFAADHIFCGIDTGRVLIVLRVPGKPEFALVACETRMSHADFATQWDGLVEAIPVSRVVDAATCEAMFDEVRSLCSGTALITELMKKGLFPL